MDDSWDANIEVEQGATGFIAILIFNPPPEMRPSIRVPIGEGYGRSELAEAAALDAFMAMTRRGA
ncbi:hypothetical protein ACTJKJ_19075 [Roseateles sp. 22389]|uniref:hypothetical protein n=1 Tax=Roseateles sp. 22389 TaxID=3453916 RepID=UPI003F83B972